LNSFPDWIEPNTLFNPQAYWARDLIRGALSKKLGTDYDWTRVMSSFKIYEEFIPRDQTEMLQSGRESGGMTPGLPQPLADKMVEVVDGSTYFPLKLVSKEILTQLEYPFIESVSL
jgi:hypothetical protein